MTAQPEILFSIALDGSGGSADLESDLSVFRTDERFAWTHVDLKEGIRSIAVLVVIVIAGIFSVNSFLESLSIGRPSS